MTLGFLSGAAVFAATNWLVLKGYASRGGTKVIGPHLQLLSQYLIGYRVSFAGSLLGFIYGFVIGAFCGTIIGLVYNKIVELRGGR